MKLWSHEVIIIHSISMNSFILISQDQTKRKAYIEDFCAKESISPFDQTVIQTDTPSIGIEVIRDMQKTLYFKPLKGEKKLITIENAHTLTTEAQNALLKILEEPPVHTHFFLSASVSNAFLPTILSRCKLILLEEEKEQIPEETEQQLLNDFQSLTQENVPFKLYLAEKLSSDKEKAKEWLSIMIHILHKKLLENPQESREVARVLEKLQEAYTLMQTTNVNLRLLLEHTFLELI